MMDDEICEKLKKSNYFKNNWKMSKKGTGNKWKIDLCIKIVYKKV